MAKTGIRYVVFGKLDESTGKYSGGKTLGPASTFNGTPTKANAKDFGDDHLTEYDNSVTGGTLSVELNEDTDEIYTFLLGHKAAEEGGEIAYNANDVAPFVGVGAIGKSGKMWVVKFYKKVKFSEPNDDNATKQENVTFTHITLEGEIFVDDENDWKVRKTFDSLTEAKTYLNGLVGIDAQGA